jgi:hypothetical protein
MSTVVLDAVRTSCQPEAAEHEVAIVMPCLNEARTVGRCVAKAVAALQRLGVNGEVIVADNGSTDGSQEIAKAHGARVIHATRRGYGSALQAGVAAAQSRYIIMGDADDSYDFSSIDPFIDKLRHGDELVMGNRFKGGIRPGAMPWLHRYVGNPILTGILNLFFHTPIGDAHCGLRAFRKDAFERLKLNTPGMEFASEMVVKSSLQRQRISEVPVVLHPDGRDRPPHLRSFRDGWRHLRFLLLFCPLWLYLVPSALLGSLGLSLMLWLTPGAQHVGQVEFGLHSMLLGALCVFLGYQTMWLWAFAKIHGWMRGMLPPGTFSQAIFRHLNLERGLILGGAMAATGLGLCGWLALRWIGSGYGDLDIQSTMRGALWGFLFLVLGVQTVYSSFFLSMLGMGNQTAEK